MARTQKQTYSQTVALFPYTATTLAQHAAFVQPKSGTRIQQAQPPRHFPALLIKHFWLHLGRRTRLLPLLAKQPRSGHLLAVPQEWAHLAALELTSLHQK